MDPANPQNVNPAGQVAQPATTQAPATAQPAATQPPPPVPVAAVATGEDKMQLLKESILSNNVPQMVLFAISAALEMRSSDIHIEPHENTVLVRYRVDGVLKDIVEYPNNMHPAVVSRIKIMSNLKIDEQRIPQDGRTNVTTKEGKEMDLRVSSFPTANGEKIVMRIQDKSREIPTLEQLGITGNSKKFLERALKAPNGIILTSGPTGSGKTTTLYSCLHILNNPQVNILTIEDPVEIQIDGLNQSQVRADIGYSFATGLRASLRQDPDIMMVGEIRDHETINVAIEAALTGHLVLSTIHTNSAVETLTRIINMEVPPYLLASTVEAIIAQRLVRKLKEGKKQPVQLTPEMQETVNKAIEAIPDTEKANYPNIDWANPVFYGPMDEESYEGRVGLYEAMPFTTALKSAVLDGKSTIEIEEIAVGEGMVTLEQCGVIRALEGLTSLEEVYRVANVSY